MLSGCLGAGSSAAHVRPLQAPPGTAGRGLPPTVGWAGCQEGTAEPGLSSSYDHYTDGLGIVTPGPRQASVSTVTAAHSQLGFVLTPPTQHV